MDKDLLFLRIAHASPEAEAPATETHTGETVAETAQPGDEEHAAGLTLRPTDIGFQVLNFLVLLFLLNLILYKPLTKLLNERAKRIKDGVENAEKADFMLKESQEVRADMIKGAKVESQTILDSARKSGEKVKTEMLEHAHQEADKVMEQGRNVLEGEREKAAQELRDAAAALVIKAAEKILKEKLDPSKDARLIEDSLKHATLS